VVLANEEAVAAPPGSVNGATGLPSTLAMRRPRHDRSPAAPHGAGSELS
jgi:UDP-N-acetylmuramyl pentapeptide synthase